MGGDGLTAAILVGGQSRRMGTNKALLTLDPSGPTIVETVARKLSAVASEVVLVGSETDEYAFLDLPQIADMVPGTGVLGGIYSALAATGRPYVLVVACDLPFLNVSLLRYMASRPRHFDVLVPSLDQLQPLHAIYARTCLPLVEESLRSGRIKVTGWFEHAKVHTLERSIVQRYDPMLLSTFNMNTPEDLETAKQMLANSPAADTVPSSKSAGGD
jgi:molybdopterin-guanine dinucleotide biosynthesis protein A